MSNQAAIADIQARLEESADPKTKEWWEAYLKGVIGFRGVKMAGVRAAVEGWLEAGGSEWRPKAQRDLAIELIQQPLTEDKLAGMVLIQDHLIPAGEVPWRSEVRRWARLFDGGHLADWNSCDWFCVRVLGRVAERDGEECARAIAGWKTARNLWRRRAAGVAFVNLAPHGDDNFAGFTDMLLDVCSHTVRYPERFAQTGTGWVLRELSRAEPDRVRAFVTDHDALMSTEARKMATARL